MRVLPQVCFIAALALLALALLGGGGGWTAVAAAAYFLSYVNGGNVRRVLPAVVLLALSALSAWSTLPAACFLLSLWLTEVRLSHRRITQAARLLAAALGLKAVLLVLLPEVSPNLQAPTGNVVLTLALAAVAALVNVVGRGGATRADPLLSGFLTLVLFCYFLAVGLLATTTLYLQAVLLATLGLSVALTVLALLTAPFVGGASLDSIQYAFSLRVPIEGWSARISALATEKSTSAELMEAMPRELMSLPGVVGASCRLQDGDWQTAGDEGGQALHLTCPPLQVNLRTRRRASPWEWFNYYLPVRVAAEYCRVKQREERHRADNLSRAVHETGARLTHDIKNILHALAALTHSDNDVLIKRQLPVLRERLESALRKLRAPVIATDKDEVAATGWWEGAMRRHRHQQVRFVSTTVPPTVTLPPALFDLALDNFIGNALVKRQTAPTLAVAAALTPAAAGVALRVTDDGDAVAAAAARNLFSLPVESQTGFGVALYQVGVEAGKMGYVAELESNVAGKVVFCLRPAAQRG